MSLDHFRRSVLDFDIRRHAFVLNGPLPGKIIEGEDGRSDAAAVDRGGNAECPDQASPCARTDHWPQLAEMKHVRQGVAPGTCRLVDDHYLRPIDSGDRRGRRLAVTLHKVAHQFSIQFVDDVIRNLAAVIVSLVDDRAVFVLLRVVVTSEVGVTGAGGIRKPNVGQFPV